MGDVDSKVQALLKNNHAFTETWHKPPTMEQMRAAQVQGGGGIIILTCLDPRCIPEQFFGPLLRTPVIRNAGGRASKDAVTSITVLRSLMNAAAVLVVHHTDCGMTHVTEESLRKDAKTRTPEAEAEIDATGSYGCFEADDFERTIMEDVGTLQRSKVLAGVEIRGFAMDTETGVVTELKDQSMAQEKL
ncbi:hypothetical protein MMC12_002452 [Toensbergia leucococca]|nr:hypothetical protein [Toensbergia leucococca]